MDSEYRDEPFGEQPGQFPAEPAAVPDTGHQIHTDFLSGGFSNEDPRRDDSGKTKRRERREKRREAMLAEDAAGRPGPDRIPKRRVIFWALYWGAALLLLVWNRNLILLPEEEGAVLHRAEFNILMVALLISAWAGACLLRPQRRYNQKGREIRKRMRLWHLLLLVVLDIYAFFMIELINNEKLAEMQYRYMALNVLGIFIISLLVLLFFNSVRKTMLTVLFVWTIASLVFYFVFLCRGEPFQLIDIFSFTTAMSVARSYKFEMTRTILVFVLVSMCLFGIFAHMRDHSLARRILGKILMRAVLAAALVFGFWFYLEVGWNGGLGIMTDLFAPIKTYRKYGTTVGFFCVAKYMRLTAPEGYSAAEAARIAEEAVKEEDHSSYSDVKPVNIIVIMNEAWADYRYIGDFSPSESVMPYFDSMKENTIKGHTLVCITGGGTAKTEYEFLTGNSVKRFPGMVPYVSYFTHDQYSIVTTLESQGYESAVMHPYKASNWNRPTAYRLLNFDRFYTQDDFDPDTEKLYNHITDKANYEKIIELTESRGESDAPLFLFDITMQNHGGYSFKYWDGYITVDGYDDETKAVTRYLSLVRESDKATEYLIEHYKQVEEPTLILMFGDHYPTLPEDFAETVAGAAYDDLGIQDQMRYYATPFFIWANYDIPEADDIITSTNYLSTLLLEQTGLEMSHYNYYLRDLMEEMPALNHLGYFDSKEIAHTWKNGDPDILELERQYECLQYNELAETRKRLKWFYGV